MTIQVCSVEAVEKWREVCLLTIKYKVISDDGEALLLRLSPMNT